MRREVRFRSRLAKEGFSYCEDLSSRDSLRVYEQRIKRCAARHKQPVAMHSAKTKIRATLRQINSANQFTVRIKNRHAIQPVRAHAPAAPKVSIHIHSHSV